MAVRNTKSRASKSILLSQLCLFGFGLLCVLIKPKGLRADDGLSYYGTFWRTLLPYIGAVIGSSLFIYQVAKLIVPSSLYLRRIRTALSSLIVFATGIVLTPYSLSSVFGDVHVLLGTLLFATQFSVATWLAWQARRDFINVTCFFLLFASGLAAGIYLPTETHGFLIQTQALFQLWFSIIMFRTIALLLPKPEQETDFV